MLKDLILGTAGHIDHGKTSLIGALTGTNTDRLPEEKKRGITIELGYAHLDIPPFRLGIVDVPGHEKFVRQMLAGATGMDLALLVIASDDSVKQQTKEHLDILRMLDLPAGVIALTKCDLSEPEWLELVEDEIQQLVSDTFLKDAPIIRTSSKTGEGIDQLKEALTEACHRVAETDRENRNEAPFRMAIDRAFTVEGHGTVVTGSVSSGVVHVGDTIEIQPGSVSARVRGLQNHDAATESVQRGQRAAINLAGVNLQDIERGHELCDVGHLVPSESLLAKLFLLDRMVKPLKDRSRVRFHVGTAELFANIRLLDRSELAPGQSGWAQIFLNEPTVTVWNQPFVIRRQSPVETIGGGRILHPNPVKIKKPDESELQWLTALADVDPLKRASAATYFSAAANWQPDELSRTAGIVDFEQAFETLKKCGELAEIPLSTTRSIVVHRQRIENLTKQVLKTLEKMHREHPLRFAHPRHSVETRFAYLGRTELLDLAIEELKSQKKIVANVNSIALEGYGPKLSKGQKQLMEEMVEQLRTCGLKVPARDELQAAAKKNRDAVVEILDLAAENGQLVKASDEFYFHSSVIDQTRKQLADAIAESDGLTMSEIRQLLDTSRKYAIPLCEYFDRTGFTRRQGDKRVLGAAIASSEPT
jgi:selenocysteine-specific elongation factor